MTGKFADLRADLDARRVSLATMRKSRGKTQVEIAPFLAMSQSAISRLERQHDARISTIAAYVTACGGELVLLARFDDAEYQIKLPKRVDKP
jgi:hypothetical protein